MVDPFDDVGLAAWYRAFQEGIDAGRHCPATWKLPELTVWLRQGSRAYRWQAYAAVDGKRVVGGALVTLPLLDNLKLVMFDLAVPPVERRHGVGSALYQRVLEVARGEGRRSLLTEVVEPYQEKGPDAGIGFAEHRGFTCRSRELHRVLDLPVEPATLDRLARQAAEHHGDYRFRAWSGPCPDDLLIGYVTLCGRMMHEVPLGDLDYEPEHWDAARVRDGERWQQAQGRARWITVAVSPDGTLAGYTVLTVPGHDPEVVYQDNTLVLPEHRGHRLGVALKVANLRAVVAAHPQRRLVHTWNAEDNDPMVAVNDAMGFRPVERIGEWQRDL
ncbi:MAG TPA: GNAT family N-acetyltransferase [Micromonosporaceae bacterium]